MRTPKRKRKCSSAPLQKKQEVLSIRIDPIQRHILEVFKLRSPPESQTSDAKIIRYALLKIGQSQRQRIIEKIAEHDNKADWWRNRLKEYDQNEEGGEWE